MNDAERAWHYHREVITPELERDGAWPEMIAYLQRGYVTDVFTNAEAIRQLREMYPDGLDDELERARRATDVILLGSPELWESLEQMRRGEGRVIVQKPKA